MLPFFDFYVIKLPIVAKILDEVDMLIKFLLIESLLLTIHRAKRNNKSKAMT